MLCARWWFDLTHSPHLHRNIPKRHQASVDLRLAVALTATNRRNRGWCLTSTQRSYCALTGYEDSDHRCAPHTRTAEPQSFWRLQGPERDGIEVHASGSIGIGLGRTGGGLKFRGRVRGGPLAYSHAPQGRLRGRHRQVSRPSTLTVMPVLILCCGGVCAVRWTYWTSRGGACEWVGASDCDYLDGCVDRSRYCSVARGPQESGEKRGRRHPCNPVESEPVSHAIHRVIVAWPSIARSKPHYPLPRVFADEAEDEEVSPTLMWFAGSRPMQSLFELCASLQIDGEIDLEATIDEEAQLSDGHDSDAFDDSEGSEVAHDDQLLDAGDKPTPEVRGRWANHCWTDNAHPCCAGETRRP